MIGFTLIEMRISYLMKTKKEGVGPWRFYEWNEAMKSGSTGEAHSRAASRTKNSLVSHGHGF